MPRLSSSSNYLPTPAATFATTLCSYQPLKIGELTSTRSVCTEATFPRGGPLWHARNRGGGPVKQRFSRLMMMTSVGFDPPPFVDSAASGNQIYDSSSRRNCHDFYRASRTRAFFLLSPISRRDSDASFRSKSGNAVLVYVTQRDVLSGSGWI